MNKVIMITTPMDRDFITNVLIDLPIEIINRLVGWNQRLTQLLFKEHFWREYAQYHHFSPGEQLDRKLTETNQHRRFAYLHGSFLYSRPKNIYSLKTNLVVRSEVTDFFEWRGQLLYVVDRRLYLHQQATGSSIVLEDDLDRVQFVPGNFSLLVVLFTEARPFPRFWLVSDEVSMPIRRFPQIPRIRSVLNHRNDIRSITMMVITEDDRLLRVTIGSPVREELIMTSIVDGVLFAGFYSLMTTDGELVELAQNSLERFTGKNIDNLLKLDGDYSTRLPGVTLYRYDEIYSTTIYGTTRCAYPRSAIKTHDDYHIDACGDLYRYEQGHHQRSPFSMVSAVSDNYCLAQSCHH